MTTSNQPSTPAAEWRVKGQPDPHGTSYDHERAKLMMGNLTDDELANAAFMNYDVRPSLQDIINGKAFSPIAYMTAVKDRIRWLSRKLVKAANHGDVLLAALDEARIAMRAFADPDGNMPEKTGEFADLKLALANAEKAIAGIKGPWCCEKGQSAGKQVCDECAEINDGYQSCLGISPEERARREGSAA